MAVQFLVSSQATSSIKQSDHCLLIKNVLFEIMS